MRPPFHGLHHSVLHVLAHSYVRPSDKASGSIDRIDLSITALSGLVQSPVAIGFAVMFLYLWTDAPSLA